MLLTRHLGLLSTFGSVPSSPNRIFQQQFLQNFESFFFKHHTQLVRMCDYASAGNGWNATNLYRTWLPQPLYMAAAYPADTWKLMYPDEITRPAIPSKA